MKKEYVISSGFQINRKKAQAYGEFLTRYSKTRKGIEPKELVKTAKSEDCPLHDYFEWDDSIGGEKYRIEQARYLLKAIKIVIVNAKPIRAFFNVKIQNGEERQVYYDEETVRLDDELKKQIVQAALNELIGWKERYKLYCQEFGVVFKAIEETQKSLTFKK